MNNRQMTANLTHNVSLQLISDRSGLAEAIDGIGDVTLEQVHFLNAPGGWKNRSSSFDITVLDMSAHGNTTEDAISHISTLKEANPSHVVIVIGNKSQLADLLDSDAQPLLYRVFSNNTSTRQILSAIRSAGQLQQRAGKPPIPLNVRTNLGGDQSSANDVLADAPVEPVSKAKTLTEPQEETPSVAKIKSIFARVKRPGANKNTRPSRKPSKADQADASANEPPASEPQSSADNSAAGRIKSLVAGIVGKHNDADDSPVQEPPASVAAAEPLVETPSADIDASIAASRANPPEPPVILATREAQSAPVTSLGEESETEASESSHETSTKETRDEESTETVLKPDFNVGILHDSDDDEQPSSDNFLTDAPDETPTPIEATAGAKNDSDKPKSPSVVYIYEDPIDDESSLRKAPFLIFATVGMPSLALIAYLLLGNDSNLTSGAGTPLLSGQSSTSGQTVATQQTDEAKSSSKVAADSSTEPAEKEVSSTLVDSLKTVGKSVADAVTDQTTTAKSETEQSQPIPRIQGASIEQLLKWGQAAEAEARMFEPKEDNAVFYYEAMLKRNSANPTAKNGRFRALKSVETEVQQLVSAKQFINANEILTRFEYSLPKHPHYQRLFNIVNTGLESHIAAVQADPNGDINGTIDTLNQLGTRFSKPRDAMLKIRKESTLLAEIDLSIDNGILMPPDQRNAFDRIMQARKNGLVSTNTLNDRALKMSALLYSQAESLLESEQIDTAAPLVAAVELLNVDQSAIKKLQLLYQRASTIAENGGQQAVEPAKKASLELNPPEPTTNTDDEQTAANQSQAVVGEQTENLITEAKVLHFVEPEYPSEAENQRIEGWVELNFVVDEQGNLRDLSIVNEQPANVFSQAAMAAVTQWRFEPAVDQIARANVASNFSVRLDFTLPQ